jgi:phosphoribosylanthranilate isomerase
MSVRLKVCGITSLEDALAAVAIGAEDLGFNFYPKSPRYIDPAATRAIIERLPPGVTAIGVFVNQPSPKDVEELMRMSGVRMAQLHGDEDADYCRGVGAERVIKAFRVGGDFSPEQAVDFPAQAILLDAFDRKLYGGTGKTIDWTLARQVAAVCTVYLAGGLSPENIVEAVEQVRPFAVDVNSGVESAPGQKDHGRLQKLKEEMQKLR